MARGWDVLLSGERVARGRMNLGDGSRIRGVVRQPTVLGVQVSCEVFSEAPLGAEDLLETALEERGVAGVFEGAVRAVV
jgi:Flp pilus assembly CpaF family ATPase